MSFPPSREALRFFPVSVCLGADAPVLLGYPSCRDYAMRRCRDQSNKVVAAKDRRESVLATEHARVFNAHGGSGQWYSRQALKEHEREYVGLVVLPCP